MLIYGSWDLPGLDYFQFKNSFKGSRNNFRFVVSCGEDDLIVKIWTGEKCFELSDILSEKHFEMSEQALYDINSYLTAEYKSIEV